MEIIDKLFQELTYIDTNNVIVENRPNNILDTIKK